jgi:hypothetical protein
MAAAQLDQTAGKPTQPPKASQLFRKPCTLAKGCVIFGLVQKNARTPEIKTVQG